MNDRRNIANTLAGSDTSRSRGDCSESDLARGYSDAAPTENFEASLTDPITTYEMCDGKFTEREVRRLPARAGMIEHDGFERTHGCHDEYGFIRRPTHGGDVERE